MSRRVAITITLSVRIPLPPGYKQQAVVKQFQTWLEKEPVFQGLAKQISVKVAKREVTYL